MAAINLDIGVPVQPRSPRVNLPCKLDRGGLNRSGVQLLNIIDKYDEKLN